MDFNITVPRGLSVRTSASRPLYGICSLGDGRWWSAKVSVGLEYLVDSKMDNTHDKLFWGLKPYKYQVLRAIVSQY